MGSNNQNAGIHIERNRLVGNGSTSCNGGITIARGNPDTLIVNNFLYNNGRNGITFSDADGGPHYLANNTIYLNGWNGVHAARQHLVLLVNNLLVHNGAANGTTGSRFGVQRESSTTPDPNGIQLLNNLLCGNSGGEIGGPVLNDTDVDNLTPSGTEGPGVNASLGCEALNTLFANINGVDGLAGTEDDDLALATTSPAIDQGVDPRTLGLPAAFDGLFEADYQGEAHRPQDGNGNGAAEFDLGALEAEAVGGCTPGTVEACYEGPEGTQGVGPCHAGTRTCQTNHTFGACTDQVVPQPEILNNGLDEDCDGTDLSDDGPIPPDPSTVVPSLDLTVATDLFTATQFLYTGTYPIQTGVELETIDPQRVAVVRGKVSKRDGTPLPRVAITILNHPEFGQTLSRGDGMFDLVVNGGGILTVTYTKPGYLPAQRQVDTQWRDYVFAADVALIQRDTAVTPLSFGDTAPPQVARGSVVTDTDGTRRATLLFPEGTHAELEYPDGTRAPQSTLYIRATEYTVGENGPIAMPAELPPTSAYTYAVELEADEAVAVGAVVQFDRPVAVYVENFLGFPVGAVVPLGLYDRTQGVWVGSDNGRVIKVLSLTDGKADVDTDGDEMADDALTLGPLGITETERTQLTTLYPPGQTLWRVTLTHFSSPDMNWGGGGGGEGEEDGDEEEPDDQCEVEGSIIGCDSQSPGGAVDIVGTPFRLHYQSNRVSGRTTAYTREIRLRRAAVPAEVEQIVRDIWVAGRRFTDFFSPTAPPLTTFTWDGKDAYGRTVQGKQPITIIIGFLTQQAYCVPADPLAIRN